MMFDMIGLRGEDKEVSGGIVGGIFVDVVDNVIGGKGKEFRDNGASDALTLSGDYIRVSGKRFDISEIALGIAEGMGSIAYSATMP